MKLKRLYRVSLGPHFKQMWIRVWLKSIIWAIFIEKLLISQKFVHNFS